MFFATSFQNFLVALLADEAHLRLLLRGVRPMKGIHACLEGMVGRIQLHYFNSGETLGDLSSFLLQILTFLI